MMFPSGVFLSWISLIFQFKLCLGIHGAINISCMSMIFFIRSGIQIPLIWYIAVADRFTTTEITYIQVGLTLPQARAQKLLKGGGVEFWIHGVFSKKVNWTPCKILLELIFGVERMGNAG